MASFLEDFEAQNLIDLLIVNAGVLEDRLANGRFKDGDTRRRILDIDLLGAIDTVHAVLPHMIGRASGQITIVSSLAGLSLLASAPVYSARKAGLLAFGKAMRVALAGSGVGVSVACPGHVIGALSESHIRDS